LVHPVAAAAFWRFAIIYANHPARPISFSLGDIDHGDWHHTKSGKNTSETVLLLIYAGY